MLKILSLLFLSFVAQKYICHTAKVDIIVSDSPKLVALVEELNNPEDTNATITCSIGSGELDSVTYEWYKDKERLYPNLNKVIIDVPRDNYQSVLRIFNLKPDDSALYTCVAKNRFGVDKISTKLIVKVQLKWISEPPTSIQVPVKKAVHVPCLAEGSPEPNIGWRRVSNSGTEDEVLGSSLRFSSIEQKDAGYYECRASNGVEEDLVAKTQIHVLVNVTVSKVPKILDLFDRLNQPEETNATFTCSISSGDLSGLTYEWRKDDVVLNPTSNPKKIRLTTIPENYQSILRVNNLEPSDAGVFSCVARNRYGEDKISIKLSVKVHLKWISEPKDTQISAGRSVHIPCVAGGSPKPVIEWTKLGDELEMIGQELRFNSIGVHNSGYYECKAKNGVDEDLVAKIALTVLATAVFWGHFYVPCAIASSAVSCLQHSTLVSFNFVQGSIINKEMYLLTKMEILRLFSLAVLLGFYNLFAAASEVSKAPKIVDPVERLNHPEETNATFTCSIGSGDLEGLVYEWKKDDITVNQATNPKKLKIAILPENYQSILRVINLEASDAGIYSCIAKNKFGQDRVSTRLFVKVQMKWISEPKDTEASVGKPIHIPCSADGLPKPTIEWTKLGDESRVVGNELRFSSSSLSDAGYYECRAKNGIDEELVARIKLDLLAKSF